MEDANLSFILPDTQHSGSNSSVRPMAAVATEPNLEFEELLGTLRLEVIGDKTIKSIEIASLAGEKLSGRVNYNMRNASFVSSEEAVSVLTLDCGDGIALSSSAKHFEVRLPAVLYKDGFSILLKDTDGNAMPYSYRQLVDLKPGGIKRIQGIIYVSKPQVSLRATVETDALNASHIWKAEDEISVNSFPVALRSGAGTPEAEFGPLPQETGYYAVSPASAFAGLAGTMLMAEIPAKQAYGAELRDINPAAAHSTDNNLAFKYVGGVVSVIVEGEHILRSAELKTKTNTRVAGKAEILMNGSGEFTSRMAPDASKTIVMACGKEGVDMKSGKELKFVVAPGTYEKGFLLTLVNQRGMRFEYDIPADLSPVTVNRNEVTSLDDLVWEATAPAGGNLSRYGWANCYMVHGAGDYSFDARMVDGTPLTDIVKADWLWVSKYGDETANELISNISYKDGKISFTASDREGNALVAAFNAAGDVVWSWHIWLTDAPVEVDLGNALGDVPAGGYYMMDRNLGAVDATVGGGIETYGLIYQWGRKDPFIGGKGNEVEYDEVGNILDGSIRPFANGAEYTICNSAYPDAEWSAEHGTAATGTLEYAAQHPMMFFVGNTDGSGNNWLNEANSQKYGMTLPLDESLWQPQAKSNYDPCPVGYMIPRHTAFNPITSTTSTRRVTGPNYGYAYMADDGNEYWFPVQGFRSANWNDGKGSLQSEGLVPGREGTIIIWYSEYQVKDNAYILYMKHPLSAGGWLSVSWATGAAVRCVVEY